MKKRVCCYTSLAPAVCLTLAARSEKQSLGRRYDAIREKMQERAKLMSREGRRSLVIIVPELMHRARIGAWARISKAACLTAHERQTTAQRD